LEWVGVAVLPGLFFLFLFLVPFLDRGPRRSPRYRPISTAVGLLSVGAVAFLTWRSVVTTPPAVGDNRAERLTATEVLGRQVVSAQGCVSCHVIDGQGGTIGPSLDGIALRRGPA